MKRPSDNINSTMIAGTGPISQSQQRPGIFFPGFTPPSVAGVYDASPAAISILLEELTQNYSRTQATLEQFDQKIEALEALCAENRVLLDDLKDEIGFVRERLEDAA